MRVALLHPKAVATGGPIADGVSLRVGATGAELDFRRGTRSAFVLLRFGSARACRPCDAVRQSTPSLSGGHRRVVVACLQLCVAQAGARPTRQHSATGARDRNFQPGKHGFQRPEPGTFACSMRLGQPRADGANPLVFVNARARAAQSYTQVFKGQALSYPHAFHAKTHANPMRSMQKAMLTPRVPRNTASLGRKTRRD